MTAPQNEGWSKIVRNRERIGTVERNSKANTQTTVGFDNTQSGASLSGYIDEDGTKTIIVSVLIITTVHISFLFVGEQIRTCALQAVGIEIWIDKFYNL